MYLNLIGPGATVNTSLLLSLASVRPRTGVDGDLDLRGDLDLTRVGLGEDIDHDRDLGGKNLDAAGLYEGFTGVKL